MPYRNMLRILIATGCILLVPFVAMRFTTEVKWTGTDFASAASLLIGSGLMYELATRKAVHLAHRLAAGVAVTTAFLLVWLNLAVGLIGTEMNPVNGVYAGVLAVGLTGAIRARFEPRGMARALLATAGAQALVGVVVLVAGAGPTWLLDGWFAGLWVVSALLFRRAGVAEALSAAEPPRG